MSKHTENPANTKELPENFRPMSSGVLRLKVPERDGYHRHWFRGTPDRIAQARQAGYTFVDASEVNLNSFDVAGYSGVSGNNSLGSNVEAISGDLNQNGEPGKLILMECPLPYFEASQEVIKERNKAVADSITSGLVGAGESGESAADAGNRYRKGKVPDLFNPNKRRP